MRRKVVFRPAAKADLRDIYDYIEQFSPVNAGRYVERIEAFCMNLADFSERGTRRDDLAPGIRIVGFRRRVDVAFLFVEDRVEIVRILYGGRDLVRAFQADAS